MNLSADGAFPRPRRSRRSNWLAATIATALLHGALLVALGWDLYAPARVFSREQPITLLLWPRSPPAQPVQPRPLKASASANPTARPAVPAPAPAPPLPSAAGAQAQAPQAQGASADVQNALRAELGCDDADFYHLSAQDRARCRDRMHALAQMGSGAPQFGMSLERRADFDAAAARAHAPAHLARPECVLLFGQGKAQWYKPVESIKLGPLPCYIVPPQSPVDPLSPGAQ